MPTFWERGGGLGDGANDLLDLDNVQTAIALLGYDVITRTQAKTMLTLTEDQGVEFDELLDLLFPGSLSERIGWGLRLRSIFQGARQGIPALDTVPNLRFAMGL